MRQASLRNTVVFAVPLCIAAVSTAIVWRSLRPATATAEPGTPPRALTLAREVPEWRVYAAGGRRFGPAAARVTVVEFSEFQCPFCKRFSAALDSVRRRHPEDIAVVFRHFPLTAIHPYARAAAVAAECAGDQGRFEQLHDVLFGEQDAIGAVPWADFARRAGVPDSGRFARCLADSATSRRLAGDSVAGRHLGVFATPTVLVNNSLFVGAASSALLDSAVVSALVRSPDARDGDVHASVASTRP